MAATALIPVLTFAFLFFLGQLQRIELFFLPPFYLHDLLMISWLGLITLTQFTKVKIELTKVVKLVKKNKLLLFLLFWIALGWIVAFLSGSLSIKFIFYLARFTIYGLVFYLLGKFELFDKKCLRYLYFAIGFYILLFGLVQYLFMPDVRFLSILGWDDHYYRLVSTQFDPNFVGIIFVLLFFSFQKQSWLKKSRLKSVLSFFILLGIALTFSRSTYLAFFVGLVLSAGFKIRSYAPGLVLLVLLILIPKPGGEGVDLTRTASINARIETSQKSFSSLHSYQYLLGRGLFNNGKPSYFNNVYQRADHAYLEDNFLLLIFNATGIVGFVLSILILLKTFRYLMKNDKLGLVSLIAVLVHAMFNNTLFQPFVFLYLIWGLVSKVNR